MNGKGDSPRNCFSESYLENYEEIFRKKNIDRNRKTKNKHKRYGEDQRYKTGLRNGAGSSRASLLRLDEPL